MDDQVSEVTHTFLYMYKMMRSSCSKQAAESRTHKSTEYAQRSATTPGRL